jgi:hypothetical protein
MARSGVDAKDFEFEHRLTLNSYAWKCLKAHSYGALRQTDGSPAQTSGRLAITARARSSLEEYLQNMVSSKRPRNQQELGTARELLFTVDGKGAMTPVQDQAEEKRSTMPPSFCMRPMFQFFQLPC